MTQLLLHIGHPKTGTTALQSVLSANAGTLLKEASVLYPTRTTPAEPKHALVIPWLFDTENDALRRRTRSSGQRLREISRRYWQSLAAEVQQTASDLLILSAEGFWGSPMHLSKEQMAFARKKFYEIAGQVKTVGYLRSPASYFLSKMNQKLRNFRSVTLPSPDYLGLAMRGWENLGLDSHSWHVFDRDLLVGKDIVDDFCANHLPRSFHASQLNRKDAEKSNSSVSNEAMIILEELATRYPILTQDVYDYRRSRIVAILREADAKIGGRTRPMLSESAITLITNRCNDLDWLQERGISFPDIQPTAIGQRRRLNRSETFTRVADYCPIDTDRLASLRSASRKIEALFQLRIQRFFWPFRRRNRI